jgi:hypothetical protein
VEGSYKHGNVPSGSTKFWEIPKWLSDWRLLKKGSVPWSWLVSFIKAMEGCDAGLIKVQSRYSVKETYINHETSQSQ